MPDPIETPVVEPVDATLTEPVTADTPDPSAEVEKWKALSRKNEQRAKDNEAAAKRLAEIEDANRTELEKIQARAEAAEKALADRDAKEQIAALVAEVADAKNVPAAILRGATREELEEHADTYLASLPVIPNAPSADGLGNVGAPIGGAAQITSQEELARMKPEDVVAARKEGRLNQLMGVN